MSGISTRWLVLCEHEVGEPDLNADGAISQQAIETWVTAARLAYLEHCTAVHQLIHRAGLVLRQRPAPLPPGAFLGRATAVQVTASVTEVRPASFTIAVRLRPGGGDRDSPVTTNCVIHLENPTTGAAHELGTEVRDELIALEHSAQHFN